MPPKELPLLICQDVTDTLGYKRIVLTNRALQFDEISHMDLE